MADHRGKLTTTMLTCQVCRKAQNPPLFRAREMMFGFRDEFDYFECAGCGCVQIKTIPADLAKYYPANYSWQEARRLEVAYVRHAAPKRILKNRLTEHLLGRPNLVGAVLARRFRLALPPWITKVRMNLALDSKILEVGCGNGPKLLELRNAGFRNLTGVDPFIPNDINYGDHVRIKRGFLDDVNGKYDLVMFQHSLEHMPDPRAVFGKLGALVTPGAFVLIRIPVAGSLAWRKYGINWVQLDAPRHFFLFTPRSLGLLAEAHGFEVWKTIYDSTGFQFWGSEQYARDIPLKDPRSPSTNPDGQTLFTKEELAAWAAEAERLNARGEGDQACFYLRAK